MKRVAVVTDATSTGFFFPRWRRYYGRLFGEENLYVMTYAGLKPDFVAVGCANVYGRDEPYSNALRARLISDLIAELLQTHDAVIRCDVDEFLVPAVGPHADLAAFVEANTLPYVTSQGVDVIAVAGDAPLDDALPVLGRQRKYGRRVAALNKTGLTAKPLRWAAGFHAANVHPCFGGLINFHLKFADIASRVAWHDTMLEGLAPGTSEHRYFGVGADHLTSLQGHLARLPRAGLETQAAFDRRFLDTVTLHAGSGIHQGSFIAQDFLFRIDERLHDTF